MCECGQRLWCRDSFTRPFRNRISLAKVDERDNFFLVQKMIAIQPGHNSSLFLKIKFEVRKPTQHSASKIILPARLSYL